MGLAPVSVCFINREEPLIEGAIRSVAPYVKEVIVIDTGSRPNDPVYQLFREFPNTIIFLYRDCNDPDGDVIVDFSNARAYAFSKATQPWVMWADADDVLTGMDRLPALLEEGERLKEKGTREVGFLFPYEYSYNEKGECNLRHYRERLFSNKNAWKWVNPVHEVCIPVEGSPTILVIKEDVVYKHQRQYSSKKSEPGRNIRILKDWFSKNPDTKDARMFFYYGVEQINSGQLDEGKKTLSHYIDISGWDHEQFMACDKLFQVSLGLYMGAKMQNDEKAVKAHLQEALTWAFKGIGCRENWSEGYINLAKVYYFIADSGLFPQSQRSWDKCVYYAKVALSLPPTKTMLFVNPLEREFEIYRYLNYAQNKLGDIPGAWESTKAALKIRPEDPGLILNAGLYEAFLTRLEMQKGLTRLYELSKGDPRLPPGSLPFAKMTDERYALGIAVVHDHELPNQKAPVLLPKEDPVPLRGDGKYDIVFACGPAWEDWNPRVLAERGLGGSETAVIEMSKRLAQRGHRVRVYTSCGDEKEYEGVSYLKSERLQGPLTADVWIAWRNAPLLLQGTARLKWLWVHDVFALAATEENLAKADTVLALSEWHKEHLMQHHKLPEPKLRVTRNGIDLKRFDPDAHHTNGSGITHYPRFAHRAVYSSSPDRGLMSLLLMWPKIRQLVPDAELRIFYGFFNWDKMAKHLNDVNQQNLIRHLKDMIMGLAEEGVTFYGRIDQKKLATEFLQAGCLLYPTWFSESSGISLMEAQAAGLRIVTSPIAALNETVANRGAMIPGDWLSEAYQSEFIKAAVSAMTEKGDADRERLQEYAKKNFGWEGVVDQWEGWMHPDDTTKRPAHKAVPSLKPYVPVPGFVRT